jgi:hypothetical protein
MYTMHGTAPLTFLGRRVNKQINQEAKALFYSRNTFIIGNGYWGSTTYPNVQALKEFIKRVPKDCLALIRNVALYTYLARGYNRPSMYHKIRKEETSQLETISRAMTKYFTGLERVSATILPLSVVAYRSYTFEIKHEDIGGDIEAVAKPLRRVLAMPSLREFCFQIESARNIEILVAAVGEGKDNVKGMVKMVIGDGSLL